MEDPVTRELKAFGFCDFETPDGAMRAMYALNGYKLDENELLVSQEQSSCPVLTAWQVKVDEKTQIKITNYKSTHGNTYPCFR